MSKLVSVMKIFSCGNISYQKRCHEYGGCSKVCLASGSEITALIRLSVKKFRHDKESFYRIVFHVVYKARCLINDPEQLCRSSL